MVNGKDKPILPRHKSFGWLIAVLADEMEKDLNSNLETLGININHWPTLFALWEQDGLTQSELTDRCNTAHYTTTRLLDALEKKGLTERRCHPTSRRTHLVYLTKQGNQLQEQAVSIAKKCNEDFLSALPAQERTATLNNIKKMIKSRKVHQ